MDHRAVTAALSQSIVLIVTDKSVLVAVFAMIGFVILHVFQRKGAIYIYTHIYVLQSNGMVCIVLDTCFLEQGYGKFVSFKKNDEHKS